MRVITPEEMSLVDRATIEQEKIPGIELMGSAGEAVARAARDMLPPGAGSRVAVFCGKGNNGGDGFVAARLLSGQGFAVRVLMLAGPGELKGDSAESFRRLDGTQVEVTAVTDQKALDAAMAEPGTYDLVIDAIFGTGFSGEAKGVFEAAIRAVNEAGCPVLAVDIPSGVDGLTGAAPGAAVRAARTVTFAAVKVGLAQHPGAFLAGELQVADIGIPPLLLETTAVSRVFLVEEEEAGALLPSRAADAHKRQCGSVLVVGGSPGLTGAPALCARAAMRCGSGLVTVGCPESLHQILEIKLTEVMTRRLAETAEGTLSLEGAAEIAAISGDFDVVALGPGLSTAGETQGAVRELVRRLQVPLVLDADGLNAMAGHTGVFAGRNAPLVLTPHPGEMARLTGKSSVEVQSDRLGVSRRAAADWGAVVVLKGAGTVVAEPEGTVRIISSGNPGMATAGMGDVLTGCVASFIAQGLSPADAAVAGAFYHGNAADLAAAMDGEVGMLAGDVIRYLPMSLRRAAQR